MRPVIVCTARRFVAFGYTDTPVGQAPDVVRIERARCAIYFGTTGGVLELASSGPTAKSRIGARAPAITLREVTAVFDVSPEAVAKWEAA